MKRECYFYGRPEAQAYVDGITVANKGDIHSLELLARRGKDGDYYIVRWFDESVEQKNTQNL